MRVDGKSVLVTGGAGFIGSNLVDALVDRGCRVRVVDDLSVGSEDNLADAIERGQVELAVADIADTAAMGEALRGIDVVFHMAVSCLRVSLYDPWESHNVNAGGTLSLLDACIASDIERFLYCSSSEVYGSAVQTPMSEDHPTQPTTVYGASKLAGEWYALSYLKTHGLPVAVARPFNTYGYREHHEGASGEVIPKMVVRALNGVPPTIFGDGSQTRDFTFVTETAAGLIGACECDELVGGAVNIAFGREVSIARIAELVCGMCASELEPVHADARPADVHRHYADTTKARQLFGFDAKIPIEDGLDKYVTWFRGQHPDPRPLLEEGIEQNWKLAT